MVTTTPLTADDDEPKIVDCKTQRCFALTGKGAFDTCGPLFKKLKDSADKEGFKDAEYAMLVLCDVPNTAKEDLEWACAMLVDNDETPIPDGLEEIVIPGRRCATTVHIGSYHELPKSWGNLCMFWVPSQKNLKPAKGSREYVHYEVYLNDCGDMEANKDKLRTRLFCPVVEG